MLQNRQKLRACNWIFSFALVSVCLFNLGNGIALAANPAGAISQPYPTTNTNISQGSLVSFQSSKSDEIVNADVGNTATLVGIAASKPLVELSTSGQNNIQVIVGGIADALVSDANGTVNIGDKITASPITGIGMKATTSTEIVGTAQASLSSVKTVSKSFAGVNGKSVIVKVGILPVTVNVAYFSSSPSGSTVSSFIPPFLQDIANALTGKQVSPLRVLLGGAAMLLGFISVVVMMYIAIRSGVISIGRNPLAEEALRRGLVDVILAAIGVLIITIAVSYGILFS